MQPLSRRSLVRGAAVAAPVATLGGPGHSSGAPASGAAAGARVGGARCAPPDAVASILGHDMVGKHAGVMHGVPSTYDWAQGPRVGSHNRDGRFHAVSAWGQIYESADGSPAQNVRVACRDISVWILSRRTGTWRQVNASKRVNGANYVEDFVGNVSKPADLRDEAGGAVSATLGGGYNFHLYSIRGRAPIDPGDVAGMVSVFSARVIMNDPYGPDQRHLARYLASAGADYWLDRWVGAAEGTVADASIGKARWVRPEWSTFSMSTMSMRKLSRNPPPICLRGR